MKKKLVSILLSLSMCAAYANPLASVAAEEAAPAEDVTVVETAVPNATLVNEKEFSFVSTTSGGKISVEYGDTIELRNKGYFAVKGTSSGSVGVIEDLNNKLGEVTLSLDSKSAKFAQLSNGKLKANGANKTATVNVVVKSGGTLRAEGTISVDLQPKNIGYGNYVGNPMTASGSATVNFQNTLGGAKKFANLEAVAKKFNGKKNSLVFKFKNNEGTDTTLKVGTDFTAKAVIATDETEYSIADYDEVKNYQYTKKNEVEVAGKQINSYVKYDDYNTWQDAVKTTSMGAVEDRVNIVITGKKNYTGTFVVTGCQVKNLEVQRILADQASISGAAVEFGGTGESLVDGLLLNDDTAVKKTEFPSTVKFKALTKNIKVNAKNGTVTVKKVGETAEDNTAKVSIISKKNKLAATELVFSVTAKSITDSSIFKMNANKYTGTKEKPKYSKSVKTVADKIGETGKGLVFSYKKKVNGKEKVVKLKGGSSKDFICSISYAGVQLKDKDNQDTGVFVTKDDQGNDIISKTLVYTVTGVGNYIGTVTDSFDVNLVTQIVSAPSVEKVSDAEIRFGEVKESVYDYITVDDKALLRNPETIKAADAKKLLKIKAKSKNIKINKEGKLVVKKIDGNKGEIEVVAKKNKNAKYTLEFNLYTADISKATVDKSNLSKTFANAAKASAAVEKITVSFGGKKLKKNKDYTIEPSVDDNGTGKVSGTIKIVGAGNFEGYDKTESVSMSYKYTPPKNS
jgi:hypothetical protein